MVGCSKLPLALSVGEKVSVTVHPASQQSRKFELQPTSPKYRQLQVWLSKNQYGWSQYLTTTPGYGVFVSFENGLLQFTGSLVLACPLQSACVQKSVKHSEYLFLETP